MNIDISQYKEKPDVGEQFRHVDATPLVLRYMEAAVVSGVQHIFEQTLRAEREIARLEQENKALRALCKKSGISVNKAALDPAAKSSRRKPAVK